MKEQLLKTSGDDFLSSREKTQKNLRVVGCPPLYIRGLMQLHRTVLFSSYCANLADHTNEILLTPERGFYCYFFFYIDVFLSVLLPKELSKVQDNEVGDGTTSVTVLACELLRVLLSVTDYFYTPTILDKNVKKNGRYHVQF